MIRKLVAAIVVLGIAAAAAGWFLSAPEHLPESVVANLPAGDAGRGEAGEAAVAISIHAKVKL